MSTFTDTKTFGRTAEQRMRQWAMRLEMEQRVTHDDDVAQIVQRVHPYLAISREAGAGARQLAIRLSDRLGWDVLGSELLDEMAQRYDMDRGILGSHDESAGSWLLEVFGKWLDHRLVVPTEYMTRLGKLILIAAHGGSAIFLGRGAQFFLPRDRGIAVQVIATLEERIGRVAEGKNITREEAKRYVLHRDRARHDFIQQYFHQDVNDSHLYDLVINLQYVSVTDAADMIIQQCQRRFGPLT